MPNDIFRAHFRKMVEAAINDFSGVASLDHAYLKGRIREIAVSRIIEPLLPASIGIGTGKVVDSENQQSAECDVILYDKEILPPVLFDPALGAYPIESTLAVIEIKSLLTAEEIRTSIQKAHYYLAPQSGIFVHRSVVCSDSSLYLLPEKNDQPTYNWPSSQLVNKLCTSELNSGTIYLVFWEDYLLPISCKNIVEFA